ncbi:hypothetical protein N0X72_05525 [Streptomyces carpaticus]|uniref:Uncharacterized protein n=1 Tax=Streptomyces cheonanensis TaxID=312720 RepID=A0ABN2UUV5_9ACTN|nr:hypothetical protein [Streptomyces harbinensis]QKV68210.1 hypothetical protein HUT13_05040 [Streptomyces harbinensis]UWM48522.1 hypothetical protein N0X72_05525 [Streptomyces carpaticus]
MPGMTTRSTARTGRRLTRRITAFARAHGGSAEATVSYTGERGVRVVLVGADGGWGDLMAPDGDTARQALEAAGITPRDTFDAPLAAKVRTGRYEWSRMAGLQIGGPRNT